MKTPVSVTRVILPILQTSSEPFRVLKVGISLVQFGISFTWGSFLRPHTCPKSVHKRPKDAFTLRWTTKWK